MYGKGWKKIAGLIKTRTVVQIRTHAQKYFLKLSKTRQHVETAAISSDGKPMPSTTRKVRLLSFVHMLYTSILLLCAMRTCGYICVYIIQLFTTCNALC